MCFLKGMDVWNVTKKSKITTGVIACSTLWQKARGLMFRKQANLIFIEKEEKYIPLHMLFVFYPIDVVYLNKEKEVVDVKQNFLPFSFYSPKKKAQYVLELQEGTIRAAKIEKGDILDFSV